MEKRVLTADRGATSFTGKILKKINALRPKLRLPCPGVHGPLRGGCESSRGLTLPQARSLGSTSRIGATALRRTVPGRSAFDVRSSLPWQQSPTNKMHRVHTTCYGSPCRAGGRCPPAARLVATEGTVAGVKKCHRTGRDTTVNSERGECRRGRRPRVLCEINRPASSCTRTAAGSVERGHR